MGFERQGKTDLVARCGTSSNVLDCEKEVDTTSRLNDTIFFVRRESAVLNGENVSPLVNPFVSRAMCNHKLDLSGLSILSRQSITTVASCAAVSTWTSSFIKVADVCEPHARVCSRSHILCIRFSVLCRVARRALKARLKENVGSSNLSSDTCVLHVLLLLPFSSMNQENQRQSNVKSIGIKALD